MEERGNLPGFCACAGKSAAECLGIKLHGAPEGKAQPMSTSIGRGKWEDPLTTLKRRPALIAGLRGRCLYMRIPRLCRGIFLWGVSEERRHATVPPEKCSNARRQSNACLSCSRQTEERCRFRQRPSVRLGILFSNACHLFCKREYQHFAVVIAFQRQGDAIVHQGFAAPQLALLVTIEGVGKKSAHAESGQ